MQVTFTQLFENIFRNYCFSVYKQNNLTNSVLFVYVHSALCFSPYAILRQLYKCSYGISYSKTLLTTKFINPGVPGYTLPTNTLSSRSLWLQSSRWRQLYENVGSLGASQCQISIFRLKRSTENGNFLSQINIAITHTTYSDGSMNRCKERYRVNSWRQASATAPIIISVSRRHEVLFGLEF